MSREAEHAKPLPCPLHPDVEPLLVRLAQSDDWQTWCPGHLCWSGPVCKSAAEAVARWNEVVGAVTERDAAMARVGLLSSTADHATIRVTREVVEAQVAVLREACMMDCPNCSGSGVWADEVGDNAQMCEYCNGSGRLPVSDDARNALASDAGQRAAAVLKAARKWRNEFRAKGSARTTPAMVFAESDLLQAIDALDGRA